MRVRIAALGGMAFFAIASGAFAEDAVVPDEYDQIRNLGACDAYGAGWVKVPGTGTCMKVNGQARYEKHFGSGPSSGTHGRFTMDIETRSD